MCVCLVYVCVCVCIHVLFSSTAMSVMPFSVHIVMFGVFIFSNGFFTAAIDTGKNIRHSTYYRCNFNIIVTRINFVLCLGLAWQS